MPGGSSKSRFMQRCVADVTGQGKDLKGAFAVCTAQSQKSGYSEPGSTKQTGKGKAREKQFKKEPDMGAKAKSYEKAVKAGRKSEDMAAVFAGLSESSGGADKRPSSIVDRLAVGSGHVAFFERSERDGSRSYEIIVAQAGRKFYLIMGSLEAANVLFDTMKKLVQSDGLIDVLQG